MKERHAIVNNLARSIIVAGIATLPSLAMADQAPPDTQNDAGISLSGYVDLGYSKLDSTGLYVGSTAAYPFGSRAFDAPNARLGKQVDGLAVNQVGVVISREPKEGLGGLLQAMAGQDANVIAAWRAGNSGGYAYDNGHNFDVTLAYATYTAGAMTFSAGKLLTLVGIEYLSNASNLNYSHSILYGNPQPGTHTGARLAYALDDTTTLMAGVNNGWDQLPASSGRRTVELGFSVVPNKMFSLSASFYTGYELADGYTAPSTTRGRRQILDLIATIAVTDKLSLMFNYDRASQGNALIAQGGRGTAKWDGLASYVNYQFDEHWRISLRGEYVNDLNGYTAGFAGNTGQTSREATLTLAYMPAKSIEIRGEIRQDRSNQAIFLQTYGSGRNTQTSTGLEFIYKF